MPSSPAFVAYLSVCQRADLGKNRQLDPKDKKK
jgi:hypothetical protein